MESLLDKSDKDLSNSPLGRSWRVKDISGVHNDVRGDFEDSLDYLIERIINVLFPLIDAAGSNLLRKRNNPKGCPADE